MNWSNCETDVSVYDSIDGVSGLGASPSSPFSLTHVHRDGVSGLGASPSSPSSLTDVHRCIGSRNATRQTLPTSVKLTYQSVYVHRFIGSRNATRQTLPTFEKLMYLSVYDSRDGVSGLGASPSSPSSFTHVHRCIGSLNATRQMLPTSAIATQPDRR